jgi:hypothetical protein
MCSRAVTCGHRISSLEKAQVPTFPFSKTSQGAGREAVYQHPELEIGSSGSESNKRIVSQVYRPGKCMTRFRAPAETNN